MILLLPAYRRNLHHELLSELSTFDLMQHTVQFCTMKSATVFVNDKKMRMMAVFPSGLRVLFTMYVESVRLLNYDYHAQLVSCWYIQRCTGEKDEFR